MERLNIEESEALNIANQLCQYGYFFPVNDSKILVVKDDSCKEIKFQLGIWQMLNR
jgi:regulator of G-protein signaling